MAAQITSSRPTSAFEFELVEGDPEQLTAVAASGDQISPWINPTSIKLRHRVGRGPFGDVWLATHHQKTEEYEQYLEVAVKMLHPIKEDCFKVVLDKLNVLFSKCQGLEGVCWLHGLSVISGKLCIIMKFYDGSIGDQMARLKGGKLSLPDVIRYGIDLAQGITELHSRAILVLNLKPCNFLLNGDNRAIVGDLGIAHALLGIPLPTLDITRRLGTPNYMAPEQWQPEIRGPISFETDSWGFGCSIVEMLTGIQPWSGKTVDEIYDSVVGRQEKPLIPGGLPPAVENVISGCFEYDLKSRPLMTDILQAFKSSQNAVYRDGRWTNLDSGVATENPIYGGYTEWFLSKDRLQVDDIVRSRKPYNSSKSGSMDIPEGTVVGLEHDNIRSGFVLVRVRGIHDPVRVHEYTLERVSFGLAAGDWVRLKKENKKHSPVGIIHSIDRDGNVAVGFIGCETLWKGVYSDLQMAESYCVGQFVRLKSNIFSPRFQWPRKGGCEWATGRIAKILLNGCLVVKFPGRLVFGDESSSFLADPAEVELVSFSTNSNIVKKYQHLEDFHWAVRPLLIALGLFTVMKFGFFVGKKMARPNAKKAGKPVIQSESRPSDGQNGGWIPPKVANIIFREGVTASNAR